MRRANYWSWSALLLVGMLIGCDSAKQSTDGGPGGDGSTGADGGDITTLSSLDEPCGPNQLTGQQLLDFTRPQYATTLDQDGTISELAITVSYAQGEIVCYPPVPAPPGSAAPDMPEHLTVEVEIGLQSGDGAFAEQFVTTLSLAPGDVPQFSHSISADALAGSFDPELDAYSNATVSFNGSFDGDDTEGHVGKGGTQPNGVPVSFPFVAQWPAEPRDPNSCTPTPSCGAETAFACAPVTQGVPNPDPPIVCGCFPSSCPSGQFLVVNGGTGIWCTGVQQGSASCSSELPP